MTQFLRSVHWERKLSHFDPKRWGTGGTKFRPKFLGQYDSIFLSVYWGKKLSHKLSHWRNWNSTQLFRSNDSIFYLSAPREKMSHFDLKSWVLCFNLYFERAKWVTGEYLSQFDSQCWVNLTLNVEWIWLSMLSPFASQCWANLTRNVEPNWLSMLSQFDSECWSNFTLNVESIWLLMMIQFVSNILQLPTLLVEFYFRLWIIFLCQNDLIFSLCVS